MIDIQINESANVPIWIQVRNRIIYLIRSGQLAEGDRLPSVRELAVQIDINFNTVSKAYQDLEREGFIQTRRGRGTFVAAPPESVKNLSESPLDVAIDELINIARSSGVGRDELLFTLTRRLDERGC